MRQRYQPAPELLRAIEDQGAAAWQRGAAFWHSPGWAHSRRVFDAAWIKGWERAAAEFFPGLSLDGYGRPMSRHNGW